MSILDFDSIGPVRSRIPGPASSVTGSGKPGSFRSTLEPEGAHPEVGNRDGQLLDVVAVLTNEAPIAEIRGHRHQGCRSRRRFDRRIGQASFLPFSDPALYSLDVIPSTGQTDVVKLGIYRGELLHQPIDSGILAVDIDIAPMRMIEGFDGSSVVSSGWMTTASRICFPTLDARTLKTSSFVGKYV